MKETQLALLVLVSFVAISIVRRLVLSRTRKRALPFPPGPRPLPVLGNVLSINTAEPWKTYATWSADYGDIIYSQLLDQETIILNSQSDVIELFEKRSQIYSDRPFIATLEPFGWGRNLAFVPYGDHWRLSRRIFHQTFRTEASLRLRPMQLTKVREMVVNIFDDSGRYAFHYETFAVAVTMIAVYDYDPSPRDDPIVHLAERFLEASLEALIPEKAVALKLFPFLLYLPDWCPGSSLKIKASKARKYSAEWVELPYRYAQNHMVHPEPVDSMVSDHLTRMRKLEPSQRSAYEDALKSAASSAYLGTSGAGISASSFSSLMVFTLAMVLNPHISRRAQEEIDDAVGRDRLPEFDDRASLPYVEAIMRETMRWQPLVPLGELMHTTTRSDIYKGVYIPEGPFLRRAISRDETRYPNAEQFIPERFFTPEGTLNDDDPAQFIFGYGRRICPGRHTADASLWIGIATMLAAFDFARVKDSQGNEVEFEPSYVNGVIRRPVSFPCSISPRSDMSRTSLGTDKTD
ncbi:cytochrome P450 [Gyrodon lividus]|nr:cytochrome P450 [Gyrodon lividus]